MRIRQARDRLPLAIHCDLEKMNPANDSHRRHPRGMPPPRPRGSSPL
jgi:hypothetical protein